MLYKKQEYIVANNEVISDDDINEGIRLANETNSIIRITWSGPGWKWYRDEKDAYHLDIKPGADEKDVEEFKKQLPKIYGI